MTQVERRSVLRAGAAAGLVGLVDACSRAAAPAGPASSPPASPTRTTTPSAPAATPAPGPPDWAALGRGLTGPLVRPGDAAYGTARLLYSPRHDAVRPAGIAYCGRAEDVSACLQFARRYHLPVTARAGGHSYAGWSTGPGLVVDVTRMATVHVDPATGTATVGAGARLADLYAGVAAAGVSVPAGSCPTVGVAGLALGGGVGVTGRAYGLTSDAMVGASVVTADGRVRDCAVEREPDLYWACRGGGGGNMGIVTSFTFRTAPATEVTLFYLAWPWARAARVVDAWLGWAPGAPDELWSTCKLLAGGARPAGPDVFAAGTYLGSAAGLQPLLDRLVGAIGSDPIDSSVRTRSYLDAMLDEAGCTGLSVPQCRPAWEADSHLPWQPAGGQLGREFEAASSFLVGRPLPAAGLGALMQGVRHRAGLGGGGEGGISLDALGGAINRVPPQATAFVHRDSLAVAQLTTTWAAGTGADTVAAQFGWLRAFRAAIAPYGNGEAYQNYVDPDLNGWQRAYYGSNYARLVRIKARYDPDWLFRFPQGIPPR